MSSKSKKTLKIILWSILLLLIVSILYLAYRAIVLSNNDILLHYEEYEPTSISAVQDGTITYYDYDYPGWRVICSYETESNKLLGIVAGDKERGFRKSYKGRVLFNVEDLQIAKIYEFFSIPYWYGANQIRTGEECDEINRLLEAKDYEAISTIWNGEIVITTSGTEFVSD